MREVWDRIHRTKVATSSLEEEVVAFARRLPPGAPVLDAGCGRGRHTLFLAQNGLAVHGCDLSSAAIAIARERLREAGTRADLVVADLRHLPYREATFVGALCVHVLPYHRWHDMLQVARELGRVLAPGGRLYVDLLDRADAEYGRGEMVEAHTFLDPDGIPTRYVSRQEVSVLLGSLAAERVVRLESGSSERRRVGWAVWATRRPSSQEGGDGLHVG